jgi:hypothetical protein
MRGIPAESPNHCQGGNDGENDPNMVILRCRKAKRGEHTPNLTRPRPHPASLSVTVPRLLVFGRMPERWPNRALHHELRGGSQQPKSLRTLSHVSEVGRHADFRVLPFVCQCRAIRQSAYQAPRPTPAGRSAAGGLLASVQCWEIAWRKKNDGRASLLLAQDRRSSEEP